jgi:hypothetical protein
MSDSMKRGCRPFRALSLFGDGPGAACSLRFALAPGYLLAAPPALQPAPPALVSKHLIQLLLFNNGSP